MTLYNPPLIVCVVAATRELRLPHPRTWSNETIVHTVFGIHMIIDPSAFTFVTPTMRVRILNMLYLVLSFISGLPGDVHWFRRVVRCDRDLLFVQGILRHEVHQQEVRLFFV
jgi:hypothetical protein